MESKSPPPFLLRSAFNWILRHPWWVIGAIACLTGFWIYQLPRLAVRTSIYDLQIEGVAETVRYAEFKRMFGSDEIIRLVIKSENLFAADVFAEMARLSREAGLIPGVKRVISLADVKKTVDKSDQWDLKKFAGIIAPVTLFQNNLISSDSRTAAITLILDTDADQNVVIRHLREVIAEATNGLSLYQIGMPLVAEALATLTLRDFMRLPPIAFAVMTVILWVLLRNVRLMWVALTAVALALIWTVGLMAVTRTPLSMLTMVVPVFLLAVGTAYGLYILSEFRAACDIGRGQPSSVREAITRAYAHVALPTVIAIATTAIGLGSLLVNRIPAIREFTLFACFGLLCLLLLMLTFFPAALLVSCRGKGDQGDSNAARIPPAYWSERILNTVIRLNLKHRRLTLAVIGVFAVVCLIGIFRLEVETDPVRYFKRDLPIRRNFHDVYRHLAGSFPMNVVMAGSDTDYFEEPQNIQALARLQTWLQTLPGVDKSISIADYLMLTNYVLNRFDSQYYRLPAQGYEIRRLYNNLKGLLGDDIYNRFVSPDLARANVMLLTHLSGSRTFLQTREAIIRHVEQQYDADLTWSVTGLGVAVSAGSQQLVSGQIKSLSLTMVLIFGIMLLLFLSGKVGLIALIPNAFPILVNFGLMGWLGIELSMVTTLIASIAIGLAVDDTIHYLVRYNREFKKDLDKDRALTATIRAVGRPIIWTTLTIGIGFSVLTLSHFQPTAVFGLLIMVTMLAALVGDLILLPSLMLHVELVTAWDMLRLMPTAGGVSATMAHELNQPLNAIKMGNEFLKLMVGQGDKLKPGDLAEVVAEIGHQVDRAAEMIKRRQEFGRVRGFETEAVDLNQPVRATIEIVGPQLHIENIQVVVDLADNLPPVQAHPNRLGQVIFNLLDNARTAFKGADVPSRNDNWDGDGDRRSITIRTFSEGRKVVVTVADTGRGISAHVKDRIFEPFFTTHEASKGKGLGLTISNEIVRGYGGRIKVASQPGQGTTVRISLNASHTR